MGTHSFETEPEHCAVYRTFLGDAAPPLLGVADHWNMPIAQHRLDLGKDAHFTGVGHHILTYHVGGAAARRTDGLSGAIARKGAISLQQPYSSATVSSDGVVDYAHLYFKQSLLCEVADELERSESAEPEDFFAAADASLAGDIEAYLLRAADRKDPATPIEMDSRAYLIALGVLRIAQHRATLLVASTETDMRADFRRVLRQIEDRLGESLRLSDLSDILGMSPFHFARIFKDQVGEPPAQYLQRRRTERAIELLRETRLPLSEIAFRTGFSSQSHMNRRVKAVTGLTPRQVREGG